MSEAVELLVKLGQLLISSSQKPGKKEKTNRNKFPNVSSCNENYL